MLTFCFITPFKLAAALNCVSLFHTKRHSTFGDGLSPTAATASHRLEFLRFASSDVSFEDLCHSLNYLSHIFVVGERPFPTPKGGWGKAFPQPQRYGTGKSLVGDRSVVTLITTDSTAKRSSTASPVLQDKLLTFCFKLTAGVVAYILLHYTLQAGSCT